MKKIILISILTLTFFGASAGSFCPTGPFGQILPGAGYQAYLHNQTTGHSLEIRTNTIEECLSLGEQAVSQGYYIVSQCRAQIFII